MLAIVLGVEAVPLHVHLHLRHGNAAAAQGCAASSLAMRTRWKRHCSLQGRLLCQMKLMKRLWLLLPRLLGVKMADRVDLPGSDDETPTGLPLVEHLGQLRERPLIPCVATATSSMARVPAPCIQGVHTDSVARSAVAHWNAPALQMSRTPASHWILVQGAASPASPHTTAGCPAGCPGLVPIRGHVPAALNVFPCGLHLELSCAPKDSRALGMMLGGKLMVRSSEGENK